MRGLPVEPCEPLEPCEPPAWPLLERLPPEWLLLERPPPEWPPPEWPPRAWAGTLTASKAARARGIASARNRLPAGLGVFMGALLFLLRAQLGPSAVKTFDVVIPQDIFP